VPIELIGEFQTHLISSRFAYSSNESPLGEGGTGLCWILRLSVNQPSNARLLRNPSKTAIQVINILETILHAVN
jgi:hypothetical protein